MYGLNIKKLYYSISEVSEMTRLKPYILRYWESEFVELRPSKNRAGNRIYRSNDIDLVLSIKKLLYEEKFTIAGAKQKLKGERSHELHKTESEAFIQPAVPVQGGRIIKDLRKDLIDIKNLLTTPK